MCDDVNEFIKSDNLDYSLSTPYFQSLGQQHPISCQDEPYSNFTAYSLFCLKSRLSPRVYDLLKGVPDLEIIYLRLYRNGRMEVTVRINKINKLRNKSVDTGECNDIYPLTVSQKGTIQGWIDQIVTNDPDYCLIGCNGMHMSLPDFDKYVSMAWVKAMLPYVSIITVDDYNNTFIPVYSYVTEEGIFLSLPSDRAYMQTYDRVLDDTLIQLRDMYQAGVVLVGNDDVSREFVDNWKLLPVDLGSVETMGPKVYYAEWVDGRFAPDKVSFLTGRLQGIPHISLKIPDNLVSRHYVAKVLSQNTYDFVFNGPYVEVITNTLAESQRVADMVDEALYNLSLDGRVVVFTLSDIRLVDLYKQVSADLYNDNSGGSKSSVSYKVSNFYVFSQLIEPTKVVFTEEKRLKRLVYAKLAETSKF
jgi:hypothetical protein